MSDDSTERWLPIAGFEGFYEVSDHGQVRSLDREIVTRRDRRRFRGRTLKPTLLGKYPAVVLTKPGIKPKPHRIHRLVAETFLGQPLPGFEVCHNDGDRFNNQVENLRWDTRSGNHLDKRTHGTDPLGSKSECIHGHEYTPGNTITHHRRGWITRSCRRCTKDRWQRKRADREAAGEVVERRPWKDAKAID